MSKQQQDQQNKEIAQTILQQIGNKVLVVLGAQYYLYDKNQVQFKVQGVKKFNTVIVKLNGNDLYDLELWYCKTISKDPYIINKKYKEHNDIDFEQLPEILLKESGRVLL